MVRIMDCTLRDGANVVGKGFDAEITRLVLRGLVECGVKIIEYGNALGIGAYVKGSIPALSDEEYLEIGKPYINEAQLGMFMGWKNGTYDVIQQAQKSGLTFLRVGANAGDGQDASEIVQRVKKAGLICRYSMMKAYVLSADELAEEAKLLEGVGVDELTIMDSAGTMKPDEVTEYVQALKKAVKVPVAFHGHNNLGLASANLLAAYKAGADVIDCCLLGMARSAGNIPLELAVALLQEYGEVMDIDFYKILTYLDSELIPAMKERGYHVSLMPIDLIYGLAGAHSSFAKLFKEIAQKYNVNEYKLIMNVSAVDRKSPSPELVESIVKEM